MMFAESQSINLATYVINKAIDEQIGKGMNLEDIMVIVPNPHSTVTTYQFDAQKVLEVSTNITNSILSQINSLEGGKISSITNGEIIEAERDEEKGIIFYVPLGRVVDNVIIGSIGPNIPVKFHAIGDVQYNIETFRESHQINNTWLEIRLHIKVGIQIIVPFETKLTTIERNVPLAMGYIKGDVPEFYNNQGEFSPAIEIPINQNKK